jgi:glutathione S-transferase
LLRILDLGTSVLTSLTRCASGARVGALGARPERPLELYEFEACPFCRKVREALSILDLEAVIYPCPKGGPRFRPRVVERGGKAQFPYLVDPNTGEALYESDDIVRHLFRRYGAGRVPPLLAAGIPTDASLALAGLWCLARGATYRAARQPSQPLELWGYEANSFCRSVREVLCSLELPYLLHNVAKGSPRRPAFAERSGRMRVPYLYDPNTDAGLFESGKIVAYLEAAYAQ